MESNHHELMHNRLSYRMMTRDYALSRITPRFSDHAIICQEAAIWRHEQMSTVGLMVCSLSADLYWRMRADSDTIASR
jgi:hypothetical protein